MLIHSLFLSLSLSLSLWHRERERESRASCWTDFIGAGAVQRSDQLMWSCPWFWNYLLFMMLGCVFIYSYSSIRLYINKITKLTCMSLYLKSQFNLNCNLFLTLKQGKIMSEGRNDATQLGQGQNFQGTAWVMMPAAELFNVISPTFRHLAMWDTVQMKSSDRIHRGSCVYVCARETRCVLEGV